MEARSGGAVCRRLFRLVIKEHVPLISGRTITPKCRFSSGSIGKINALPRSAEGTISGNISRGSNAPWSNSGLSTRGRDSVMVRRVEGLGGVRFVGFSHRPTALPPRNAAPPTLPYNQERHTQEFLRQAKTGQAVKIARHVQTLSKVAGQSLAATETEVVKESDGKDAADSDHHVDLNGESLVDEDVKRGLMADSALPIGRTEKKGDEEEHLNVAEETEHHDPVTKVDVSEHGSFKTL